MTRFTYLILASIILTTAASARASEIPLNDVPGMIEALIPGPRTRNVGGTYSFDHIKKGTYKPGVDHVQGITKVGDQYVITQGAGEDVKAALVVVTDGEDGDFHLVGNKYPHCGAIQACGDVVVVPVESWYDGDEHVGTGSEILFLQVLPKQKVKTLKVSIQRPDQNAGAAGIAYHARLQRYFVVVYDAGKIDLYKSNGKPLTDALCRFSHVAQKKWSRGSQGGAQLLYDVSGKMYLASMVNSDGYEKIHLDEIDCTNGILTKVSTKKLSKYEDNNKNAISEPGFRWGGALVVSTKKPGYRDAGVISIGMAVDAAPRLNAIAVSRQLNFGPVAPTKINTWTPDWYIEFKHNGGYVANFQMSWKDPEGKRRDYDSGDVTLGWRRRVDLPAGVTKLRVHAKAAVFVKTWRDLHQGSVTPNRTYVASGTTVKRKWYWTDDQ